MSRPAPRSQGLAGPERARAWRDEDSWGEQICCATPEDQIAEIADR
ncbi:MAG: hypothetical protein ACJ0K4_04175 [Verrucomicrobiales bacterium]